MWDTFINKIVYGFGFGFGMGLSVKVCSILFRTDKNLYSKRQIENNIGKGF